MAFFVGGDLMMSLWVHWFLIYFKLKMNANVFEIQVTSHWMKGIT